MAVLLDTSAVVIMLRRAPPPGASPLREAAIAEAQGGRALLSSVTTAELFVGEPSPEGRARLAGALGTLPAVPADGEIARIAGEMGSFLRGAGAQIPFPDLLVAATAVFLDVPLLTWDREFSMARATAKRHAPGDPGCEALAQLRIHPASLGATGRGSVGMEPLPSYSMGRPVVDIADREDLYRAVEEAE